MLPWTVDLSTIENCSLCGAGIPGITPQKWWSKGLYGQVSEKLLTLLNGQISVARVLSGTPALTPRGIPWSLAPGTALDNRPCYLSTEYSRWYHHQAPCTSSLTTFSPTGKENLWRKIVPCIDVHTYIYILNYRNHLLENNVTMITECYMSLFTRFPFWANNSHLEFAQFGERRDQM